jgi:F1F0 ATPase subunit 2
MALDAQRMTGIAHTGVAALFALLGALAGAAYMTLLSWTVRALAGRSPGGPAEAVSQGRAAVALAVFAFAALHGAAALVAALAGFLLSRAVLTRRPEWLLP